MKNFIVGTVFGIVICTIGFGGVARLVDAGVIKVQEVAKKATE